MGRRAATSQAAPEDAACYRCENYGDHGGRPPGTPPWSVCRFGLHLTGPPDCGWFQRREDRAATWPAPPTQGERDG